LVSFGVQLWMYATPIVYTMSELNIGWMRMVLQINPVTAPVELFRYAVLGQGAIMPGYLALSGAITLAVVVIGVVIYKFGTKKVNVHGG
jgi:lipopolysaccharide transport system permease protein